MAERPASLRHPLTPILLQGSLHETLWGGRNLARYCGKQLPDGARVGESWETATDSVARNAPYAGHPLAALVESLGADLLGSRAMAVFGPRFPLLTKFIDAQQQLSVQVHPSDAYAASHEGGKLGKTEVWYILHAEPGACVVYGLSRDVTRDEVAEAIAQTRLEALLHRFEARPGDVIFVPAGVVHAIGSGIVLYELQEYSDITYRLYDYGRLQADGQPRELHVDSALAVMRYTRMASERTTPVVIAKTGSSVRRISCACRHFVLEETQLNGATPLPATPASCQILSVIDGSCTLAWPGDALDLRVGDTVVLPAAGVDCTLTGRAHVMRSYVPEPDDASLAAWRTAQPVAYPEDEFAPVSGPTPQLPAAKMGLASTLAPQWPAATKSALARRTQDREFTSPAAAPPIPAGCAHSLPACRHPGPARDRRTRR